MRNKTVVFGLSLSLLTLLSARVVRVVLAQAGPVVTSSRVASVSPKLGCVSVDGILRYEDVQTLPPSVTGAVADLRTGHFEEAATAFRAAEMETPHLALAYRGENESARAMNTLNVTTAHYRRLLAVAETRKPQDTTLLATLHYALGDALMAKNYTVGYIGDTPHDLGPEPKSHLLEATRLRPGLLVAHLALAAYFEHPSQQHGTAARREYARALTLRPDLFQIRYLHAASWDRVGYVSPAENARLKAMGVKLPEDRQAIPQNAITECLALIHDHPDYPPPYYRAGRDFAFPFRDYAHARHYLAIYAKIGDPSSEWWRYATAEVQTIDRGAAGKTRSAVR